MERNLKGDYPRLIPGLCLEDRTNWYASSRWRQVIWLVLGGRLWSTCTGIKREKVRSGEDCDWKEVSHQDCWKRTGVHFNFWLVLLTS